MASMEDRLNKLREERIAREKARIEKLRELNRKKYSSNIQQPSSSKSSTSVSVSTKSKPDNSSTAPPTKIRSKSDTNCITKNTKNILKRPIIAPKNPPKKDITTNNIKPLNHINDKMNKVVRPENKQNGVVKKAEKTIETNAEKIQIDVEKKVTEQKVTTHTNIDKNQLKAHKSITSKVKQPVKVGDRRKTMLPEPKPSSTLPRESVFDRLYKPKVKREQPIDNVSKLKTDPTFLKKVIKDSQLLTTRRHTTFEQKTVRRSISAIHFKKVKKSELNNCVHKWASVGEKIDTEHLQDVNEDDCDKDERVVSAIKSERKRVKFQTPLHYNTTRPEELQSKLQNWLQKRGKSLDSYHHLQCFGINHMKPINAPVLKFVDEDENKENIALDHDSDNDSYLENNNQKGSIDEVKTQFNENRWRRASNISETSDFNESGISVLTSTGSVHHVEELLLGALTDLTELLRDGYDWEQCGCWLRVLRDRFPAAPETAPFWECRAALEERRGDLHATVQCLERAIAKGTEQSVVEANLDSLLDKFMQLKISPSCGRKQVDPKLVDVKNVFKSTIIRFAVQQAKLSQTSGTPKYTVTPVRRSHRLSRSATPLQVCTTIRQARALGAEFKPNKALGDSP